MKFLLVVAAAFALVSGTAVGPTSSRTIGTDIQDILSVIPIDQIKTIIDNYSISDPELVEVIAYLKSEPFKTIVATPEGYFPYINLLDYLQAGGFDIYGYLNVVHEFIGLPPLERPIGPRRVRAVGRTFKGMVDEIIALIPFDQVKTIFAEKLQTSSDFQVFYNDVRDPAFQAVVEIVNNLPEYVDLLQKLRDRGIDIDLYISELRGLFGL